MTYIALTGGAYQTRGLIAACQRCLNLVVEPLPQDAGEMTQAVHNPTPGTYILSYAPSKIIRCLYTATNGDLYAVCGQQICYVNPSWQWQVIGTITPSDPTDVVPRVTPVSMADNGNWIFIVDNTVDGYMIRMSDRYCMRIDRNLETGFYGATRVEYSDTFFILNQPKTPNFYLSQAEADPTAAPPDSSARDGGPMFDPLDFAGKSAQADDIVTLLVEHRVIWLLGRYTTEIYYNTGGSSFGALTTNTFAYEAMPGGYTAVGCAAIYSAAHADNIIYFLSQDVHGQGVVVMGSGYSISRISTHSIEVEISKYSRIDDAVGFCYQQDGHSYYQLSFPTADKTWVYDATTKLWHERCWLDANGQEHRHRANCATFAYGKVVAGDWENANLYCLDLNTYTDGLDMLGNTRPIKRYRSFPHMVDPTANRRVFYQQFIANMAVGTSKSSEQSAATKAIDVSFTAPNGTDLSQYSNPNDTGGGFTMIAGGGDVENGAFYSYDYQSIAIYQCNTLPATPNYIVDFSVVADNYTGLQPSAHNNVFVVGRANSGNAFSGYRLSVNYQAGQGGNGFMWTFDPQDGSATASGWLGQLSSGQYNLTMQLDAEFITVYIQRSVDNLYWANATWGSSMNPAYSGTNYTWSLPGVIIIGNGPGPAS